MGKFSVFCGSVLCVIVLLFGIPIHAQTTPNIFEPDRGPYQLAMGYQYQSYKEAGHKFHDNGYNTDFSVHAFDWITGASLRVAVAAEGTVTMGFGGNTGGATNLQAKSLFFGGGPHVSIVSNSRIEPWIHVLPGWQHFRFAQGSTGPGTSSAFGFMGGGGIDVRLTPLLYWRVQGDYIGTHFQHDLQSNFSIGSGFAFYF